MGSFSRYILVLALLVLAGCSARTTTPQPQDVTLQQLGPVGARNACMMMGPEDMGLTSYVQMEPAILHSLDYIRSKDLDGPVPYAQDTPGLQEALQRPLLWRDLERTLEQLLALLPRLDKDPGLLAKEFRILEILPSVKLSGYFVPEIPGVLTPDPAYPYPIYGLPRDLKTLDLGQFKDTFRGEKLVYRMDGDKVVPYYDREAIDFDGVLKDQDVILAWTNSLTMLKVLQTQGSGVLRLPDGSAQRIGYAGKNGRPFQGLSSIFIEHGYLGNAPVTLENMRNYLDRYWHKQREVLSHDKSYVFFRLLDGPVLGAMTQPLTDRISVATDKSLLPLGSLVLYHGTLPVAGKASFATSATSMMDDVRGLVLAQDRGGAIKGAHMDFFWGTGDEAGVRAWRTWTQVRAFMLLARDTK